MKVIVLVVAIAVGVFIGASKWVTPGSMRSWGSSGSSASAPSGDLRVFAGLYRPALLADTRLWLLVTLGSIGYVAIGTVVISVVRRQTTMGTVSILYLMVFKPF